MKKLAIGIAAVALSMVIGIGASEQAEAKVKTTFKKGTLTVQGSGLLTKNFKVKGLKSTTKVKKIVVKNGFKSISNDTFRRFKKVKEISIPKSVKNIGSHFYSSIAKLDKLTIPGKFNLLTLNKKDYTRLLGGVAKKVYFNTGFDTKVASHILAKEFVTSKSDSKFKSIDGCIYTKDGKSLVRVPARMTELAIDKKCEEFCLQSVLYTQGGDNPDYFYCWLNRINIPASVKSIESEKYFGESAFVSFPNTLRVVVDATTLDAKSIMECSSRLNVSYDDLMYKIPDQIVRKGDYYLSKDGSILYNYTGSDTEVTIPEGVSVIGVKAFSNHNNIEKINFQDSVVEICDEAFKWATDCNKIVEIKLPSGIKKIGDNAFYGNGIREIELPDANVEYGTGVFENCIMKKAVIPAAMTRIPNRMFSNTSLESIVVPDTVVEIGESAFENAGLSKITIGKGVKKICRNAFASNDVDEIDIPATVSVVEDDAFSGYVYKGSKNKKINIKCSSSKVSPFAFDNYQILNYKKFTESRIPLLCDNFYNKGKKYTMNFSWARVKSATGYEIMVSTDSKYGKKKNTVKKIAKSDAKKAQLKLKLKSADDLIYARIRPIMKKGKKTTYGKWVEQLY